MNNLKKMMPLLMVLILIFVIIVVFLGRAKEQQMLTVYKGNLKQLPLEIKLGHYQDTQCGMPVTHLRDSAQVSAPDGKSWFFDDAGCLALWIEDKEFIDEANIWVYSEDTSEWIDGRTAWYSLTDDTPMHYGFRGYKQKKEGFIDFKTMQTKMLRGENMTDPYLRKELLGNR